MNSRQVFVLTRASRNIANFRLVLSGEGWRRAGACWGAVDLAASESLNNCWLVLTTQEWVNYGEPARSEKVISRKVWNLVEASRTWSLSSFASKLHHHLLNSVSNRLRPLALVSLVALLLIMWLNDVTRSSAEVSKSNRIGCSFLRLFCTLKTFAQTWKVIKTIYRRNRVSTGCERFCPARPVRKRTEHLRVVPLACWQLDAMFSRWRHSAVWAGLAVTSCILCFV